MSARSVANSFDITKSVIALAVAHAVEEVVDDVLFADLCDGRGVCCDQPAAKLPGVRFCDDSKETPRRRLDAAQELVRAL